jgi:hypothetical protein
MREVKTKINGVSWAVIIVNTKEMKKQKVGDFAGLCVAKDKTIYIHEDDVNIEVVTHELFHAYVSDLHLDDTNEVSLADVEEIFAGLITAKGEKMINQAKRVTKKLKQLLEEN